MNNVYRTILTVIALTIAVISCSEQQPRAIEQTQETTAVQDTTLLDTLAVVPRDTLVFTVTRDTITLADYEAVKATLAVPKSKAKGRQRKKAKAPSRQGLDCYISAYIELEPTDLGLYGNVESVKKTEYSIFEENGKYIKQKTKKYIYELNERGDFIKVTQYEPGKEAFVLSQCYYNKDGKMTYRQYNDRGWNNEWRQAEEKYKYDDEGKLIAKESGASLTIFQYDRKGQIVKELTYDADTLCYIKKYDNKGRIIKELSYECDTLFNAAIYRYSRRGSISIKEQLIDFGEWYRKDWYVVAEYDVHGRILEEYNYYNPDCFGLSEYSYDKRGNRTSYSCHPRFGYMEDGGDMPALATYTYDSYNRLISSEGISKIGYNQLTNKYDTKGNLVHHKCDSYLKSFKYDSVGNVVETIEGDSDSNRLTFTEYEITYRK